MATGVVGGLVVVVDGGVVVWVTKYSPLLLRSLFKPMLVSGGGRWLCGGVGDKILLAAFAEPFHTNGGGGGVDACCVGRVELTALFVKDTPPPDQPRLAGQTGHTEQALRIKMGFGRSQRSMYGVNRGVCSRWVGRKWLRVSRLRCV